MKLTEENKQKIQELYLQGVKIREIAKVVGITPQGVGYWTGDREAKIKRNIEAYRSLPVYRRRQIYNSQKVYRAAYFKNRYNTNQEFRERHRTRCRNYKRNQTKIRKAQAA